MPNPTAPPPAPLPVADTGGKGAVKAAAAPAGDLEAVRRRLRRLLPSLRREYPIKSLGVFGSFARGEQTATSDLDILVEFDGPIGLFGVVGLQLDLSEHLGRTVDLVTRGSLSGRIGERILAEVVPV